VPDKSPLVTIGMPLYNEERYLRQTLDSLISQDYANFEIIISDNGSVDGTSHICQEYAAKDQRVHYYRNETNIGAAGNFQRVFELAQGDYFVWVAGHDLWHRTFLSRCLEIFSQDASIVLCYPQALWINTEGQPLGLIPSSVETRGLDRISRLNVVLWGLGYCYPVYGLISSQALRKVSLGLQVIATDAIILAELSLLGAFAHITEPLLYMRKMDDFGSWDKYIEKLFMQSLSDLSPPSLYWQMIDEHLKIVSKHIGSSLEKDAATLSTVLCLLTKYSWVLNGIEYPKGQLQSSKSDVEERINQLGSQIHDVAMSLEKQFIDDKLDANQKVFPKILIDGVFFQLYKTGIARVWNSLLEKWAENSFGNHIIVLDRAGTASKIAGIRYLTIPAYNYGTTDADRKMLQQVCDELEADLFISTYYTTPLSTPSVFIAYDMTPEVFETNLEEPMWREKHYGIRHASAYITISHNTASDLLKFFPDIAPELVTVAYCGISKSFSPANPEEIEHLKIKYNLSKPYFMMVGAAGGHKNAPLFLQAFAQLPNQPEFDIVCTGHSALTKDEFEPYTSGSTVHKLPLSDEELKAALSGAVALVYPSQYEGFGLPILEAMACGCPVITCPNASIPEVAGEAALYVQDDDVEAMAIALINIQKPEVREALIAAGIEQAKKFSWSKMSKQVSYALIQASLLPFKLRDINFIIFPDWEQAEETIFLQMEEAIGKVITHPDRNNLNLLIDTSNLTEASKIDADLVVSGAVMSLLMKEDTNISTGPEITILGRLSEVQWQALLSRIQARISMERENIQAIANTKALALPLYPDENCEISCEQVEAISMDSSRDLKDRYTDYVYHNCPSLDANSLARVATILESTCWEEPTSSTDLNNVAVLALIVAEQSQDLSERQLYLNMALEALNQGIEQDSCPLCTAHLALLLTMTGEMSQAIELAFPALINTVPNVYSTTEQLPSGLVYLPSPRNSLVNTLAEQLTHLLQARDAYTQALFLLSEVLCRTHIVFYGAGGLRLLNLADKILPDSSSIKFKLGVSCIVNNLMEGLVYLHQAKQLAPQSAQIFQALYLAYRDRQDRDSASYWLNEAREFYKKDATSLDWQWAKLGVNSSITYLPLEKKLLLAVEPSFRSLVTGVLLAEGDWFEQELEFWRNWLKPGMTVIDVGANVGVYTFTAARRVGPRGRVLAVEPFSGCLRCLEETCRINELDWVKICGGAASDRSGTARLQLYTASELNEIVIGDVEEPVQPGSFEEVPCFTLDSLVEQENVNRVDYLKIDAEGHEMSVLIGSEKILSEFFPIILYENIASSKGSNLPVAEYLKSKGYKLFRYQPYAQELIPINSSDELEGNLNVIAVPDSKTYLISQS